MMKIPIKSAYSTVLALALVSATPLSALTVQMSDTVSGPVVIADGGADDLDAATVGELLYDSAVAATTLSGAFSLIEFSATTKPVIGSPGMAQLAVEIEANSDNQAEVLQFAVTETDFTLDGQSMWTGVHALGGFAAGSVLIEAFWDPGNAAFAATNSIGGPFAFGSTVDPFEGFGSTLFESVQGSNPFSMTTVFTITHQAGDGLTEFASGASLAPVPLPASLPLLLGALGFGALLKRRKTNSATV